MRYELLSYQLEKQVMIINMPAIAGDHPHITRLADELSDVCTSVASEAAATARRSA